MKNTEIKWVLKNKQTGELLNKSARHQNTKMLKNAYLFPSRSSARLCKEDNQAVYKVLIENGKPRQIIEGDFGSRFGRLDFDRS
jgi:hypothetical protein